MSLSLILACVWVVVGSITALLPMRYQYLPGSILFLSAPVLVVWLSRDFGWWIGVVAVLAFVSMFRRPLLHWVTRGRYPRYPE